ncbi:MAG: accessory gene regulator B family protein [Eubacterium sp.]|nr:accessory gene regulator B family protein [Clostridiales bacterium]MBR6404007.1 accessory gene regulator B family protein [Eubacterium sp.]
MEYLSSLLISRMIIADVISRDEAEQYKYDVQVLFERIISYSIIIVLALLFDVLWKVLLFFISFSLLRTFAGGYHCKSYLGCLVLSSFVSLSGCFIYPLICKSYLTYQGGVIISMIIVIIIGSINNSNIHWSSSEYAKTKSLTRLLITMEGLTLILLELFHTPFSISFFISYGIVACAISMLVEIRKRGGQVYENCGEKTVECD